MTGREAIAAVCRMTCAELRRAEFSHNYTLRSVARWALEDSAEWREILTLTGNVQLETRRAIGRSRRIGRSALLSLWRQKAWTLDELAAASGYERGTLRVYAQRLSVARIGEGYQLAGAA